MKKLISIATLGLVLTGCGSTSSDDDSGWFPNGAPWDDWGWTDSLLSFEIFPDNTEHYTKAPELAVIKIPDGMETVDARPMYHVPQVQNALQVTEEFQTPRPAPLTSAADRNAVRIQRLGDEAWALVAVAPGQLWPQIRAFLTASSIGVATVDANAGLIDTQFVELQDRALKTRFRFRIDSGIQRNTAELHILQQDYGVTDNIAWPKSSDDDELEQKMLRNVAQYIANSGDAVPVSMMADRAMGDAGRIEFEDSEEITRLRLKLAFDRAWASTSKGLEDSGFVIDDRNRSEGVFYATFVGTESEEEEGFFDWVFGSDNEHPLAGRKYQINVLKQNDQLMFIEINDERGGAVSRKDRQALLTMLKGNIN